MSLVGVAKRVFSGVASGRRSRLEQGESVPVINVADLRDGRVVDLNELSGRPIPADARSDRCRVEHGDIVLTSRGTQLRVALIASDLTGAAISSNLVAIRPGPNLLGPVLFAYFQSPRGRTALLEISRTSTHNLALSAKSLGRLSVPIPPMEVQRQIAKLVSAAEDNYAMALRAAGQRRAVAQAVANDLLMGALFSEPPERN